MCQQDCRLPPRAVAIAFCICGGPRISATVRRRALLLL